MGRVVGSACTNYKGNPYISLDNGVGVKITNSGWQLTPALEEKTKSFFSSKFIDQAAMRMEASMGEREKVEKQRR